MEIIWGFSFSLQNSFRHLSRSRRTLNLVRQMSLQGSRDNLLRRRPTGSSSNPCNCTRKPVGSSVRRKAISPRRLTALRSRLLSLENAGNFIAIASSRVVSPLHISNIEYNNILDGGLVGKSITVNFFLFLNDHYKWRARRPFVEIRRNSPNARFLCVIINWITFLYLYNRIGSFDGSKWVRINF